jgi:hypothetical protein
MGRRALTAVVAVASILGGAVRGEPLTCLLVPLVDPRAPDQTIVHVRILPPVSAPRSGGLIHARILHVLAGDAERRVVRIDARWVFQWRMGLPQGHDGLPASSEWVVTLARAERGSGADYRLPLCRALLSVTGGTATGYISSSEREESMPLAALRAALPRAHPGDHPGVRAP